MPPVHVQGPVCPDHVAASAWLPVVGVSRGYTDHHQGRAIHMADSRIH